MMFDIQAVYRVIIGCHDNTGKGDKLNNAITVMESTLPAFTNVSVDNDSRYAWGWYWVLESDDKANLMAAIDAITEKAAQINVALTPEIR